MRRAWALLAIVLALVICSAQTTYKNTEGYTIVSATGALLATAAPVLPTWTNSNQTGAVVVALSGGGSTLLTNITTGTGSCGATCVGTGANLNMYTYTIPAGTIPSGKGLRVKARWTCSTCTAATKTYRWVFGGTTLSFAGNSATTTTPNYGAIDIFNNPGSTTSQTMFAETLQVGALQQAGATTGAAENTANAITLNFIFSVTATDTMTPVLFTAELIQ